MTSPLSAARIGYGAYARSMQVPGDRRRFCAYAKQRGLDFEYAGLGGSYDVVYLTHNSDLAGWLHRKKHEGSGLKLVFELVDSYLTETGIFRRLSKGAARRLVGTDSRLSLDFLETLEQIIRVSDAVICSTEEQKAEISLLNKNVFISFDFFQDDITEIKTDYRQGERLKLVWEGQPVTLHNLALLAAPLRELRESVELHVITDPVRYRYMNRFRPEPTRKLLDFLDCPVHFHDWTRETFSETVTGCDVGIIPIDVSDAMMKGKPENKLVLFWQLGLPALVSPTPSYSRAAAASGLDILCRSTSEWQSKLEALAQSKSNQLRVLGEAGRDYAADAYSAAAFRAPFDRAFQSVGYRID